MVIRLLNHQKITMLESVLLQSVSICFYTINAGKNQAYVPGFIYYMNSIPF